jgi:hypothetical protein
MIHKSIFRFLSAILVLSLTYNSFSQEVVINEFMADNESALQDSDGDFSDWIEIYNSGNFAVNLKGYGLSDNRNNLRKWLFPNLTIPAKCHILIYASGKNRASVNELHTNFKISADGEELFLTNNLGILIDCTPAEMLLPDESMGRFPDGSENWFKTFNFTPGESNNTINHLLFSAEEGYYNSPFYLSIQSLMNDSVWYTLNGSEPTVASNLYTDSIFLNYIYNTPNYFSEFPSTPEQSEMSYKAWECPDTIMHKAHIVRCASFRNGIQTSKIYTHTFFVDSTIFGKYSFPVVSLVTDEKNLFDNEYGIYLPGKYFDPSNPEWTGNYFQSDSMWERPVYITLFDTAGHRGFSQDAGFRIHGFKSRQAAQKSFRLYARKEYGIKDFYYPLLPQRENKEYKRFLLRATMGDWWYNTLIRDVLAQEIAKDLDLDYQSYQPAIVYLNGEYWGIYFIRDHIDERYISYLYGYDKDSVDLIGGNYMDIYAGSNKEYIKLADFINRNNLAYNDIYEYVLTKIDISNFIDYYIAEMFMGNMDWPFNNQKLWRPQTPDGKWRWVLYDVDAGFGDVSTNMLTHSLIHADKQWDEMSVSTFIFKNLLKNEQFIDSFLKRYAEVLNNNFNELELTDKLNKVISLVENEIPHHISRWNFPASFTKWNNNVRNKLLEYLKERPCAVEKNILDSFPNKKFGFTCNKTSSGFEKLDGEIIVGPNPSNGSFFIYNYSKVRNFKNFSITDIGGRTIWSDNTIQFYEGEKKQFNLSLPSGVYFLKYSNGENFGIHKLVISQ